MEQSPWGSLNSLNRGSGACTTLLMSQEDGLVAFASR